MGKKKTKPLAVSETGPYAEMSRRPLPDGLLLVFVPSLAALLARAEQLKGGELTRDEALRIRDASNVLVTVPEAARAMEERRGYADVGPSEPWESWQRINNRSA